VVVGPEVVGDHSSREAAGDEDAAVERRTVTSAAWHGPNARASREPDPREPYVDLRAREAYPWLHTLIADKTSSSPSSGMSTASATTPSKRPLSTVLAIEPAVMAITKPELSRRTAKLCERL
jgi:hypothetical protein